MSTETLLARYLTECARLHLHGEIRAFEQRRTELVARNGAIESEGITSESLISLTASQGDRWTVVAGGTDVDPAIMVAEARALLRCTSSNGDRRASAAAAPGGSRRYQGRHATSGDNRERLIAASALAGARECEVRSIETSRTVHYATPEGQQNYPTSHASLVFRATRNGSDGEPVHVDRADSGPDLACLLDRLAEHEVAECGRQLQASPFPASESLPQAVVIGRHVAAQLLWLFSEALSGEAVAQRRSRLADQLGCQVSSPRITIIDDPCYPAGPRHLPTDDEGIPGSCRTLIDGGRLCGFLGSHGYQGDGARPGNARQADAVTAPRPAASNLLVCPGTRQIRCDEPILWITQTHGMHLSNPITGDFSAGAAGLVLSGEDAWRAAGLTVAGSVFDMFQRTVAVGERLCWVDDAESSFGAPDLRVTGLTIGR